MNEHIVVKRLTAQVAYSLQHTYHLLTVSHCVYSYHLNHFRNASISHFLRSDKFYNLKVVELILPLYISTPAGYVSKKYRNTIFAYNTIGCCCLPSSVICYHRLSSSPSFAGPLTELIHCAYMCCLTVGVVLTWRCKKKKKQCRNIVLVFLLLFYHID